MPLETVKTTAESEIRALQERWVQAVRALDIEAIMACYATDVVAFDAIVQLQFQGSEAYRKHWQYCLTLCAGPMMFEMDHVKVMAAADLACAHWLCRCGGTDETGEVKASWMRASACYSKTDAGWKIVHEHFSAPFEMDSGKALFDLKP
jgi:uncharacterized protein (TIGR02246 family)